MANTTTRALEEAKPRSGVKIDVDWVTRTARSGLAKVEQKQYAAAMADFVSIRDSDPFSNLPEMQKFGIYIEIALCEQMLGKYEASYKDLRQAAAISPSLTDKDRSLYYWRLLLDLGSRLKKPDVAIEAMTVLAADFPESLKDTPYLYISEVVREAIPLSDGAERRLKLLEALHKADYHAGPFYSEQSLWFELLALYVDKGDTNAAKPLALQINDPRLIIRLRVDKRYRPFIDADPARYDLPKAIDLAVTRARKDADDHPRLIEGATALARALKEANRADEGLSVINAAIKQAETAPKDKPAFDDLASRLDWAYDLRTRLLAIAGQDKSQLNAQVKARDVAQDNSSDPVSHAINLGDYYYQHDRPKEALEAVANVPTDKASAYGVMALEEVRACAYAELGDKANLARSLDYLHAHAIDGYNTLRGALYCAGDVEALVAITLDQLNDPKTRNDALVRQQTYLLHIQKQSTDFMKRIKATAEAVGAHKEIHEAIERYGYVDSYTMYFPES